TRSRATFIALARAVGGRCSRAGVYAVPGRSTASSSAPSGPRFGPWLHDRGPLGRERRSERLAVGVEPTGQELLDAAELDDHLVLHAVDEAPSERVARGSDEVEPERGEPRREDGHGHDPAREAARRRVAPEHLTIREDVGAADV